MSGGEEKGSAGFAPLVAAVFEPSHPSVALTEETGRAVKRLPRRTASSTLLLPHGGLVPAASSASETADGSYSAKGCSRDKKKKKKDVWVT